jgi:hypothetical protein
MDKIDNSGTAFPTEYNDRGLTMRDYFAAVALQAIMTQRHGLIGANHAKEAYKAADAMLAARKEASHYDAR